MAVPASQMAFHWPRHDCDHLLCVKLADIADCHWSGGFLIDRTDSFHINVRSEMCQKLDVDVRSEGHHVNVRSEMW